MKFTHSSAPLHRNASSQSAVSMQPCPGRQPATGLQYVSSEQSSWWICTSHEPAPPPLSTQLDVTHATPDTHGARPATHAPPAQLSSPSQNESLAQSASSSHAAAR